ncbi:Hypothetical protein RAK1035_3372 [Roseovarius sp. AK1035]|nr:Hypothetical protein RAK1035_3372 [Roseovarius sp. AK1035]
MSESSGPPLLSQGHTVWRSAYPPRTRDAMAQAQHPTKIRHTD